MKHRYDTFSGGIDLADEKHLTLSSPILPCPMPSRLRVPLSFGQPACARCVVDVGQYVSAGEVIAVAEDSSAVDIYAPLAGKVEAVTSASIPGEDGFVGVDAVELSQLGEATGTATPPPTWDWRSADVEELRRRIVSGGLVTHRRPVMTMRRWLERATARPCRTLIANVMESQPYVTADHRLLVEHGTEVVRGLAMLVRAVDAKSTLLAVDHRRTDDYRELIGPARLYHIEPVALPHKYPIGNDRMLAGVLGGWEAPPDGDVFDTGTAVIDAATCFAVYRSVACGIPPRGRVVTVSGERVRECGNFYVPFGTPCLSLADGAEPPVIHGGPMSAIVCTEDSVVTPSTSAILAVAQTPVAAPGPCIRCGWCTDHCPARLNVAALNDAFELGEVELAEKLGVMASVECGVCTYVCPARLPLTQRVKQLKRTIRFRNREKVATRKNENP
jgi:electron transport complex protein RnfC